MTGCGSFSGVGCSSPVLSPDGPTGLPAVPHHITQIAAPVGHLAFTGGDFELMAVWGVGFVAVGLLAMIRGRGDRSVRD